MNLKTIRKDHLLLYKLGSEVRYLQRYKTKMAEKKKETV